MGAMAHAHEQDITPYIHAWNIQYAIISPNDTQAFADHAKLCYTSNIKTFFDPGQSLSFFAPEQLETAMNHAHYCIVNGYEREMLQTKSGKTADELTQMYEVVIITRGAQWADIYSRDADMIHIDAIQCDHVVDPTGAGDAFRAGLVGWLTTWLSRVDAAGQWTRLAHACIQVMGPQWYVV
jgi:adenosine kinase